MKITILGVGAYGLALAKVFHGNGSKVTLWTKFKEEYDIITLKRENPGILPGVKIPNDIEITTDLKNAVSDAKIVILAVPMKAVRMVARELKNMIFEEQILCIVSKGIEQITNKFMSEVVLEETEHENLCMISGPSFAKEIAHGGSTGFVVASFNDLSNATVKSCLENDNIIVSTSKDLIGVQVAASSKNVFAILMGYVDSLDLNDSTRASVLTCLVNDQRLIIEVLGGKSQTVFTYAGIGDMLLTCMSSKSRNYTFGNYLGQGLTKEAAMEKMETTTVEGLYTLESLRDLLHEKEVEVRSVDLLYDIIYNNEKIDNILKSIKNN
ncbi:MAG: NAD(P)H-dependent glycerol-3-phosphate dehydrogenase [Clostridia bacterium]|nr:NAD(P)H-dependent glycerol-3-phosphate dehydrogenase [Clostridia bacterium]